jgi:hypothetical protein
MSDVQFAELRGEDRVQAMAIAGRAAKLLHYPKMDTLMDIYAVCSHTPLRLHELATADDFDFVHDVGGIRQHLNRQTGELRNHFVPRFAA